MAREILSAEAEQIETLVREKAVYLRQLPKVETAYICAKDIIAEIKADNELHIVQGNIRRLSDALWKRHGAEWRNATIADVAKVKQNPIYRPKLR